MNVEKNKVTLADDEVTKANDLAFLVCAMLIDGTSYGDILKAVGAGYDMYHISSLRDSVHIKKV